MSTSTSEDAPRGGPGAALIAVAALTLGVLLGSFLLAGRPPSEGVTGAEEDDSRQVAVRVGSEILHADDLSIVGTGPGPDAWIEDELLAQLAEEQGLEDPVVSSFVQRRARQVYLRDRLLASALAGIGTPSEEEVFDLMRSDSLLYMVERHYFEILAADSFMAESLRTRLMAGQSFQVTAENVSLGQKAALGGDMGFLVGGELTGRGLPPGTGRLEGLGGVVESDLGWHIFLVTEIRPLTDTLRVVGSLSEVIVRQRSRSVVDSLLALARDGREIEVDETCWR